MTYRAYFTRENTEYEVTADLYDHGEGYADEWEDTGRTFEITKEPKFYNFYAEDDNGDEVNLTQDEIEHVTEQMNKQYWDTY